MVEYNNAAPIPDRYRLDELGDRVAQVDYFVCEIPGGWVHDIYRVVDSRTDGRKILEFEKRIVTLNPTSEGGRYTNIYQDTKPLENRIG